MSGEELLKELVPLRLIPFTNTMAIDLHFGWSIVSVEESSLTLFTLFRSFVTIKRKAFTAPTSQFIPFGEFSI